MTDWKDMAVEATFIIEVFRNSLSKHRYDVKKI